MKIERNNFESKLNSTKELRTSRNMLENNSMYKYHENPKKRNSWNKDEDVDVHKNPCNDQYHCNTQSPTNKTKPQSCDCEKRLMQVREKAKAIIQKPIMKVKEELEVRLHVEKKNNQLELHVKDLQQQLQILSNKSPLEKQVSDLEANLLDKDKEIKELKALCHVLKKNYSTQSEMVAYLKGKLEQEEKLKLLIEQKDEALRNTQKNLSWQRSQVKHLQQLVTANKKENSAFNNHGDLP